MKVQLVCWGLSTPPLRKGPSMNRRTWKTSVGAAALASCALVGASVAFGAGKGSSVAAATPAVSASGTTAASPGTRVPETALTGDTLAKVKAAAIAKVGGTVDSATTENDGSNAAAAYEAHVTTTDGTHVTVILDASFNVLGTESGGPGGPG